jgi:hypothetical protein
MRLISAASNLTALQDLQRDALMNCAWPDRPAALQGKRKTGAHHVWRTVSAEMPKTWTLLGH